MDAPLYPGNSKGRAEQRKNARDHREQDHDGQAVVAHQALDPTGNDANPDREATVPGNWRQKHQHADQRWQQEPKFVFVHSRPAFSQSQA